MEQASAVAGQDAASLLLGRSGVGVRGVRSVLYFAQCSCFCA